MKDRENTEYESNRIMIVEDSPTQAEHLKYMIEKSGYEVAVARDGKEALNLADEFNPSLIISDVLMPEMNGYELCKALKSREHTKHIPVILVTALSSAEDMLESLVYSADSFISKPYNESFLLSQIKKNLDEAKQAKENLSEIDLEFSVGDKIRSIKSNPGKMLAMLVSTYEAVVSKNNELTRSQEKLNSLNENLEELVEERTAELKKINAEKDKFFSIIAHDLRSPFSGFMGLTQIIAEDLDSLTMPQVKEIGVSLSNSANNLYRLLDNLLQWSQMQQGAIPFKPEAIELKSIMDESIIMVIEQAKYKGIEIVLDVPKDLKIFADSNILQTIIRNMCSNAVKFTRRGGKVIVSAKSREDNFIVVEVKDSGIGMNKNILDNLFRIDVKTNRNGTDGEPSTGLGLLLCKEFIEKHKGKIWLESEEGKGTAFSFSLPVPAVIEENKVTEKPDLSDQVDIPAKNLKILIAEDNA